MRKKIITIIYLVGTCWLGADVALQAQRLEDFIKLASENNPGIKAKNTDYQISQKNIIQAATLSDPQLNVSFFMRPMMLPMGNQVGSISGMQMLPWPGTLKAMEKEAERTADVKQKEVDVALNELAYKVKNAWFPLLELSEQIAVKSELLEVLKTDKELATVRVAQGMAPLVDVIRADIMIDEVNTEISLLTQKRRPLLIVLNRVLNRPDMEEITIQESLPQVNEDIAILDNSVRENPLLSVFDKQVKMAEAEEFVAEFMRKPMIGAGVQYMILSKRDDNMIIPNTGENMIMPMATMTLPIWSKKYDAAIEQKILMQRMYLEMKADMENDMSAMAQMLVYDLSEKRQMYDLIQLQIEKIDQAIELVISSYSNAGAEFEEVLSLQQQKYKYESEKISLRKEYQLIKAKLEFLKGTKI